MRCGNCGLPAHAHDKSEDHIRCISNLTLENERLRDELEALQHWEES